MYEHPVVGVNGGPEGRGAVALCLAVGARSPLLVHVRVIEPARVAAAFDPAGELASRELLDRERERSCPGATTLSIVAPSVAAGLHGTVESHGADLLVLGSSSRAPRRRLLAGGDAIGCLQRSPTTSLIAPAAYARATGPPRLIGVAYDGSPSSRAALDQARRLSEILGARVARFTATGGDAGAELACFSTAIDLLVCGSSENGIFRRIRLGTTVDYLARNCACPLLVVAATPVFARRLTPAAASA